MKFIKNNNKLIIMSCKVLAVIVVAAMIALIININNKTNAAEESISINLTAGVADDLEIVCEPNAEIPMEAGFFADLGLGDDFEVGYVVTDEGEIVLGVYDDGILVPSVSENTVEETEIPKFDGEYGKLAIAKVTDFVNVRSLPSVTSPVVGYIYNGAVAQIDDVAGDDDEWFKITSGNVEGYIYAEYFISGIEAADAAPDYVVKYATITCDRLNVRQEATVESTRIGYVEGGEKIKVKEDQGDWLLVEYASGKEGYVSAEFVSLSEDFIYARTLEEDEAIKKTEAVLLARADDTSGTKSESLNKYLDISVAPVTTYTSNAEFRQALITNALQYVGNRYVSGGNSLATGTDCSGFTSLIYAQYGYALSRTPQGQFSSNGRSISYAEAQPGDIVCYSGNGSTCTHVGIYIGNGQIVHAANSNAGVCVSSIDWVGPVFGIKNVID